MKLFGYGLAELNQENPAYTLPVGTVLQDRYLVGSIAESNC